MFKVLALHLIAFIIYSAAYSQDCEVAVAALQGSYTGACVKGKAEGMGTATGTDSYTGNFKKGYPEGTGLYTWKNGDKYEGAWKHGEFDGQGVLTRASSPTTDSTRVFSGFWKKGKYLGKYDKPYRVQTFSNDISNVAVRKGGSGTSDFTIAIKSITGGAVSTNSIHTATLPKPVLTDVQIVTGMYDRHVRDESSSTVQNKYFFYHVTYPFYAIFTFKTFGGTRETPAERVGVEVLEPGNWFVQVDVDN